MTLSPKHASPDPPSSPRSLAAFGGLVSALLHEDPHSRPSAAMALQLALDRRPPDMNLAARPRGILPACVVCYHTHTHLVLSLSSSSAPLDEPAAGVPRQAGPSLAQRPASEGENFGSEARVSKSASAGNVVRSPLQPKN